MRFASFLSGEFINAIVMIPPERKLAKRTSVQWGQGFNGPDNYQSILLIDVITE